MQQLIALDEQLAAHFYAAIASQSWLIPLFKLVGVGFVYLMPLVLIYAWFVSSRKTALRATIIGLIAWQGLNKLVATLVNRPRPSESLIGIQELVFHRPDTSFPSDHSAFLMAVTLAFYLSGQKGLGHLSLAITVLVGIARVGIGVHFPGDILGGWLIGLITAYLFNAIRQPLDDSVVEPLVRFARRFKL